MTYHMRYAYATSKADTHTKCSIGGGRDYRGIRLIGEFTPVILPILKPASLAPPSLSYDNRPTGVCSPNSSKVSRNTCFTLDKSCPPVICLVPFNICVPSTETIRTYPHQEDRKPAAHRFIGALYFGLLRSHVLKAAGTKYVSTTFLTTGSAKIRAPASLHPYHVINRQQKVL